MSIEVERYLSPLRYPGGKQRLGPFLAEILRRNDFDHPRYVEPFAGGAGAALYLLRSNLVDHIVLNDADRSIYAFWFSVVHDNERLRDRIRRLPITLAEWDRQKQVQTRKTSVPLIDLAVSTLFLNRTNRSGILRGGVIGGRQQTGAWKIVARFPKAEILRRIQRLGAYAKRIRPVCEDAVRFLRNLRPLRSRPTFLYLDPPYFVKGRELYLSRYRAHDHSDLASWITSKAAYPWLVTYDDVAQVRRLYKSHRQLSYRLPYTADLRHVGREVMILSPGLRTPRAHETFRTTRERRKLRHERRMAARAVAIQP